MTIQIDKFLGDGENLIYETSNKYSPNSVVSTITTNNITTPVSIIELGETFVELTSPLSVGSTLTLTYNIAGTLPTDNIEDIDIKQRLVKLEKTVSDMYIVIQAQKEALNNRVNITAFRAWLRLVEKKTGIKLIDENLGIIDKELYK